MINFVASNYNDQIYPQLDHLVIEFFANTPIKTFGYRRFFSDGTYIALCNNQEYQKHYFQEFVKISQVFMNVINSLEKRKFKYFLWPLSRNTNDEIVLALLKYNIWNGMTLYWRENEYIESFAFAGDICDSDLQNYMINNLDILYLFINTFRAFYNRVIDEDSKKVRASFVNFKEFDFSGININTKERSGVSLSLRQMQCVELVSRGYTAKNIAEKLNISNRTVERHLEFVRIKSNCNFKSELILKYNQGDFYCK